MPAIPPLWEAYARMQEESARRLHLEDYAWGLEAGMNRLLDDSPPPAEIERTISTESRKERRRMAMSTIIAAELTISNSEPEAIIDARWALTQLRRQLTAEDWTLLRRVADGCTYEELSVAMATTAGSLRVRVYRLRRALRPVVEAVLDPLVEG